MRQAREQGLKFSALIGHGAGYGVYDEAEGRLGQGRQLHLQRRSDLDLADQPEDARSQAAAAHQDGRRGVSTRSSPARRSARRMSAWPRPTPTCSSPRCCRARSRSTAASIADALRKAALEVDIPEGGTMLGFGVKFAGEGSPMAGQNDARLPGRHPVRRRQVVRGLAEEPGAARSRAAAAGRHDLLSQVGRAARRTCGVLVVEGFGQAFRRLHGRQQRVLQGRSGRDSRPDRPERLGQEHDLQHAVGHVPAVGGIDPVRGPRDRGPAAAPHHQPRHRPDLPDPAAVPPAHDLRERRARRATTARAGTAGPRPTRRPRRRSPWSACRPTGRRRSTGWARRA